MILKILQKVAECPYENLCKHMAAVVYDIQSAGESAERETKRVRKGRVINGTTSLVTEFKNVQIVEKMLKKGKL